MSYADFYKHCLDKFEKVSETVIHFEILNYICIKKQPSDSTVFHYT